MKTSLDATILVLLPGADPAQRESYHEFTLRALCRVIANEVLQVANEVLQVANEVLQVTAQPLAATETKPAEEVSVPAPVTNVRKCLRHGPKHITANGYAYCLTCSREKEERRKERQQEARAAMRLISSSVTAPDTPAPIIPPAPPPVATKAPETKDSEVKESDAKPSLSKPSVDDQPWRDGEVRRVVQYAMKYPYHHQTGEFVVIRRGSGRVLMHQSETELQPTDEVLLRAVHDNQDGLWHAHYGPEMCYEAILRFKKAPSDTSLPVSTEAFA